MAQLEPTPFADLVTRLYREPLVQNSLFGLPRAKWYRPQPDDPDLTVHALGGVAGNPAGPATGPHTQLAQNMLLAYAAGGRVLELKTVQADLSTNPSRPYINVGDIGLCRDWGDGLFIRDALQQFVAGAMLIELFRRDRDVAGAFADNLGGAVIYDVSVGYDLAGIRRDRVRGFLHSMRSAATVIEHLRAQVPREFTFARQHTYPIRIANQVTIATRPSSRPEEIEAIGELLIGQHDFDVSIKLCPTVLGGERLRELLRDTLGYDWLDVPLAVQHGMRLAEAIDVCRRLRAYAKQCGRQFGLKVSNALPVVERDGVTPAHDAQRYLSGKPLHVIGLSLASELRKRLGADVPLGFSGGVDRHNFAATVACGFSPVTTCTDLLRSGGYGRLQSYLSALVQEMEKVGAARLDEFVLNRYGQAEKAALRAAGELGDKPSAITLREATVQWAGALNASRVASQVRRNKRYRAAPRSATRIAPTAPIAEKPQSIATFDCPPCDACAPVCPNAAIFTYPTPQVTHAAPDVVITPWGKWHEGPTQEFALHNQRQIAVFAEQCDCCGNCATACELGGSPDDAKPNVYVRPEVYDAARPHDAVVLDERPEGGWIRARIDGHEYTLTHDRQANVYYFDDGTVTLKLIAWNHEVVDVQPRQKLEADHVVSMRIYHTIRNLRDGLIDSRYVNPVNVRWQRWRPASGV